MPRGEWGRTLDGTVWVWGGDVVVTVVGRVGGEGAPKSETERARTRHFCYRALISPRAPRLLVWRWAQIPQERGVTENRHGRH